MPPLPTIIPTSSPTPGFTGLHDFEVQALKNFEGTLGGIGIIAVALIVAVVVGVIVLWAVSD